MIGSTASALGRLLRNSGQVAAVSVKEEASHIYQLLRVQVSSSELRKRVAGNINRYLELSSYPRSRKLMKKHCGTH